MTVIKRGNSYWIDIGFNHRRFRKRSPANTFKGAKNYELFLRQKLARGESIINNELDYRYTFKEIALQWFETIVKNNNKPSEISNKKYTLNGCLIPFFGKMIIDNISSFTIEQYKSKLLNKSQLSPKSINNRLSILSCCLKQALEWHMIKVIPRIKPLKVMPQKFDFLNEAEIELLLKNSYGDHHDMILLAHQTGLRFGEIAGLQWDDIDMKQRKMTIYRSVVKGFEGSPKNNRVRIIPLTNSVIEMLKKRLRNYKYVFHVNFGKPVNHFTCLKKLYLSCKRAGLRRISWHVLRHTFASHLASKGVSVFAIKELLGHSDIKMTMRYSHPNYTLLKSAIECIDSSSKFNGTLTAQIENEEKIYANIKYNFCRDAGN